MRWNFGGNLQPVRMICEYDWKECPIAVVSYVWTEIITDVIESVTGDAHLWRILAVMVLCSMLLHAMYYKMKWVNRSDHDFPREELIKVGFKMQDLELKINILTYKMQYGTWPLPHEIPTPSLNDLRNVKLTLSNTSRQNMWTKHHLHGYISKCIQNSKETKSMNELLSMNEGINLDNQNFLSQFGDRSDDFEALKSKRNLKLLHRENNCKDYETLIRTAEECRKYMDEINESNKSLGLLDDSSDISDRNSVKDNGTGTESEQNSHRFLIDPKKWHEIYKYKNRGDEDISETDMTTSNPVFSISNMKHRDSIFSTDDEQHPLKNSKNRSRLLPPGLSITFLSDKFKTFASSEKCVSGGDTTGQSKDKTSTNETLNKVKEKLESLHDIKQDMKNYESLSNVDESSKNKKSSETIALSIKTSSKINAINGHGEYERKKEQGNIKKFYKLVSSECDSSSGDNGSAPNAKQIETCAENLPAKHSNYHNERKSMFKTTHNFASKIAKSENVLDSDVCSELAPKRLNNFKISVKNPLNLSNELNKNLKIAHREDDLSPESDSSASFEVNSKSVQKKDLNVCRASSPSVKVHMGPYEANENVGKCTENIFNDEKNVENNINLNSNNAIENISKTGIGYVLSPRDKSVYQIPMETDEDVVLISQTSSRTELSKDSDTDDKSTTTLLREALEFKKALLIQIQRENETCEEQSAMNESSEYDSDDTSMPKTDNHFRSKLLDIISEEQSAGSSTEKTSRTYILSRAINETNLCEDPHKCLNENNIMQDLKYDKNMLEGESCGDSKSIVTASSSEYFSTNNITDNEHTSAQNINQVIPDGDGLREMLKSRVEGEPESPELELNTAKNHDNDNIAQDLNVESKKQDAREDDVLLENKSSTLASEKSRDILKNGKSTILDGKYTNPPQESNETCVESSRTVNALENIRRNMADTDEIKASTHKESCKNPPEKIEQLDSNADINATKNIAKIKYIKDLTSIDSGKEILSWKSISESSSNESIVQFVNALVNLESKDIDTVAEQKLMMLNSTDYEGRNFALAGSDLRYSINPHSRKGDGVIEEILEMIADSAIFKSEQSEVKEQVTSSGNVSRGDRHSEVSNLFDPHNVLKIRSRKELELDYEKLQRKHDIFSKLKSLDAFTKPLDISECNSEKNDNEEEASPLTGRTVVYICKSNMTNVSETFGNVENYVLKDGSTGSLILNSDDCVTRGDFQSNNATATSENLIADKWEIANPDTISNIPDNENKSPRPESEHSISANKLNESGKTGEYEDNRILSTDNINIGKRGEELDIKNNCNSSADRIADNLKINTNSQSKKIIATSKRNNLSKSSITNFSTDTSESYFDVSNHDFAVSSIILTSENSNFVSNRGEDQSRSDTSSSYVDASDYCSKIPSNSSSTSGKESTELRVSKVSSDEKKYEIKTTDKEIPVTKDVAEQNNLDSKHESLTRTQLMPKCTSSLPSNQKKSQLNEQGESVTRDELCAQSSSSLDHNGSKYSQSLNSERSYSKSRSTSRSCIPILKSRIEGSKRESSTEAKARSRSPIRRLNTPRIQSADSNCCTGAASTTNENEKGIKQPNSGSRRSLNKKQSYTLPSKNSDTRKDCLSAKSDSAENNECKIVQRVSSESPAMQEKLNIPSTSGQLTKECTVIYINIISDSDRNDCQTIDAKDLIKYVNEKDLIPGDKEFDPNSQSLSLRSIKSDRSNEKKYEMTVASPVSDSKLWKNVSENIKNENGKASPISEAHLNVNSTETSSVPSESIIKTANKLLSTSTLQLSNSFKIEQKEMEVLAKPSVRNTSTSVSDFPDTPLEEKRSFYNPKNEVFDLSKDSIQKEQIVLSEMLTTDPNFFECRKTHRLYNKLGLSFQEQTEQ